LAHRCVECWHWCQCEDGDATPWGCRHVQTSACTPDAWPPGAPFALMAPCVHGILVPHTLTRSADGQHIYARCRDCGTPITQKEPLYAHHPATDRPGASLPPGV
jgi:hypothetical protein